MPKRDDAAPEMITTSVAFDRGTYKRLRLLAVHADTNVRELIREAVADYLRRPQGGARAKTGKR